MANISDVPNLSFILNTVWRAWLFGMEKTFVCVWM